MHKVVDRWFLYIFLLVALITGCRQQEAGVGGVPGESSASGDSGQPGGKPSQQAQGDQESKGSGQRESGQPPLSDIVPPPIVDNKGTGYLPMPPANVPFPCCIAGVKVPSSQEQASQLKPPTLEELTTDPDKLPPPLDTKEIALLLPPVDPSQLPPPPPMEGSGLKVMPKGCPTPPVVAKNAKKGPYVDACTVSPPPLPPRD